MGQQRIGRGSPQAQCPTTQLITPPLAVGTLPCPPPSRCCPSPPPVPWHSSPGGSAEALSRDRPPPPPPQSRNYTPPPASRHPRVPIQQSLGRPGVSPAPTPLVPWGCLDQSCRGLTAGDSSFHADDLEIQRPAKAGRGTWRGALQRGEASFGRRPRPGDLAARGPQLGVGEELQDEAGREAAVGEVSDLGGRRESLCGRVRQQGV